MYTVSMSFFFTWPFTVFTVWKKYHDSLYLELFMLLKSWQKAQLIKISLRQSFPRNLYCLHRFYHNA